MLSKERTTHFPKAELLSIVVKKEKWASRIAKGFLKELNKQFLIMEVNRFKVVVSAENKGACRFYEKNGGRLIGHIEVHKGEKSNVYVFKIN